MRGLLEGLGALGSWRALGLGWATTLWNAEGLTLWSRGLEDVRELVFIAGGSLVGKRVGRLLKSESSLSIKPKPFSHHVPQTHMYNYPFHVARLVVTPGWLYAAQSVDINIE